MHDCVKWVLTGQQALKQAKEWKKELELSQPKASIRSRDPLMSPLKVHHYRGEPRGRGSNVSHQKAAFVHKDSGPSLR